MDDKDNKNSKDKSSTFTSAMDDLKGLLDKEGIKIDSQQSSDPESPEIPVHDDELINNFATPDFTDSIAEREAKAQSITEPEHLNEVERSESDPFQYQELKEKLQIHLTLQIEKSVEELRLKLLSSINSEIDNLFKK